MTTKKISDTISNPEISTDNLLDYHKIADEYASKLNLLELHQQYQDILSDENTNSYQDAFFHLRRKILNDIIYKYNISVRRGFNSSLRELLFNRIIERVIQQLSKNINREYCDNIFQQYGSELNLDQPSIFTVYMRYIMAKYTNIAPLNKSQEAFASSMIKHFRLDSGSTLQNRYIICLHLYLMGNKEKDVLCYFQFLHYAEYNKNNKCYLINKKYATKMFDEFSDFLWADYKSRKLKLTDNIKKFYLSLLYDVEQVNTAPSSYRLNPDSPSVGWTRWAEFRRDRKKRQDYRNVK